MKPQRITFGAPLRDQGTVTGGRLSTQIVLDKGRWAVVGGSRETYGQRAVNQIG